MMKKALLIFIAILAGVAWYLYSEPEKRDWIKQKTKALTPGPQTTTLYKWQDANGQWQVSNTPPPEGTPHETLKYRDDVNLIPSEAITGKKREK